MLRRCVRLPCAPSKGAVGAAWVKKTKLESTPEEAPSFSDADVDAALTRGPDSALEGAKVDSAIVAHEAVLKAVVEQQEKDYDGLDVRKPQTLANFDGYKPSSLSLGDQVRSVADFVSGHIAHHVTGEDWVKLFDLQRLEMDVVFFLWVIHLHLITRRANMVPVDVWGHRRDVTQELLYNMRMSWEQTAESLMGRPPLQRMRNFILDMYHVVAIGLEEALCHEGPGGDLAILSVLMRLMPLPRPEDLPMYTYYIIVHYIRFHQAMLDRTSDEAILKGNFHFLSPLDPCLARPYDEVEFDQMIRSWQAKVDDVENATAAEEAAKKE
eukprot:PhM_4_TR4748/c0_g1_i1/m.27765